MLDFVEEPLDQIAFPIDVLVVWDCLRSRAGRWDHSLGARLGNAGAKAIGVIALVSQELIKRQAAYQILRLEDVIDLACGQNEANGIAERIDACTDLGTQAATRTPDRLTFAPPFAPAAC